MRALWSLRTSLSLWKWNLITSFWARTPIILLTWRFWSAYSVRKLYKDASMRPFHQVFSTFFMFQSGISSIFTARTVIWKFGLHKRSVCNDFYHINICGKFISQSGFYFSLQEAPTVSFVELSFRVNLRINCKRMIKEAMLSEDEDALIDIAKALSVGKYTLEEGPIVIDHSKVFIPLRYSVTISRLDKSDFCF